jgi:DNA-binding NarL/FixJ family response regulator
LAHWVRAFSSPPESQGPSRFPRCSDLKVSSVPNAPLIHHRLYLNAACQDRKLSGHISPRDKKRFHPGAQARDLIVAFGPLAFDYAVAIRAALWPKAPLVFGEIAETAISRSNIPTATTGTTINITLGELVIAARAIVPDLKRIAIVGDLLERLPAYRHFKDEIPILARDLEFIDLTGLTMTDLRNRVSELPEHTAIIYTTINFDRAGVSFVPAEALSLVAEVANRPIVISTETFLGRGAVGGFVVTPGSVGRDAAQLASRILDGADPSTIAVAANSINEPVFDWRQLERWKVDASRLPSNSEIRFRDPTAWEQYRESILLICGALLCQTALIGFLIYEHRRRNRLFLHNSADWNVARTAFEDAIDLFTRAGMPFEAAHARLNRVRALEGAGRRSDARGDARAAARIFETIGAVRDAGRAIELCGRLDSDPSGPDPAANRASGPGLDRLTARERDVLRLVSEGLSNHEIAKRLSLSEHTVHRHVSNILTKLDLPSRAAAAAAAARSGAI